METLTAIPVYAPGVFVATIDGSKARTLRGFYTQVARSLHFPDYFGRNLDALFDCLSSLENVGSQDIVLLIKNADKFLIRENEDQKAAAMEVLRAAEIPANRYDTVRFLVQLI